MLIGCCNEKDLVVKDMTGKAGFPDGYITWKNVERSQNDALKGSGSGNVDVTQALRSANPEGVFDTLLPGWAQMVMGVRPVVPGASVPMPLRVPILVHEPSAHGRDRT